ncbi:hypothetical protein J2848_005895 [Azospirillum lipoferum]|uniref:FAS1 domain-containing protein n=1 Tax=Azospirillum lipoferum TaxID=193 RepID=A0A5A9GH81_AZOLI|nr:MULTISPECIES: fasciclin domain-containing protein [Azospirillum]KAA0593760.1 hypothetical protein FZ942_22990 [Azospirillum lipoferum]MCP1614192.1 hypothetical protein [Azospirillum lipoferum]MDW5536877.1 hypothetical protein [Azospirillum sp. NL1]
MRFLLAKCVWGTAYVDSMLMLNLPSLLAPGNLPALVSGGIAIEHAIYTTASDAAVIQAHPVYRALQTIVPCRIEILTDRAGPGDYSDTIGRMNVVHARILKECAETGTAWLFDQPDHVWGNRALSHLVERAGAGVRCVMFAGIRTVREDMLSAVTPWRRDVALDIPHRVLIGLGSDTMHVHDMVRFWGMPVATTWPHHVSWKVGARSFLRRSFHPQPFLIASVPDGVAPSRSVDQDFVDRAYPNPDDVEFVRDTDDFAVIEVSPRLHVSSHNHHPLTLPLLAAWMGVNANTRMQDYFTHAIRFRGDESSERRWRRMEAFSKRITDALDRYQIFRHVIETAGDGAPVLATLLGRLLRDPSTCRHLTIPAGPITLLLPEEDALRERLDDEIASLSAFATEHLLAGDWPLAKLRQHRRVTTLGGRSLSVTHWNNRTRIEGVAVGPQDSLLGSLRIYRLAEALPLRPYTASTG